MGAGYDQHFGLRGLAFEPGASDYPDHLSFEDIEPYLVERLRAAGWEGTPVLDLGLAPLLHEATGGERAAIDRAMTALLEDAAQADQSVVRGDRLAAWLDTDAPSSHQPQEPVDGLVEAQIHAIEGAFAEHDRKLARLRRELADLRDGAGTTAVPDHVALKLQTIEARLDQQDAALRHILEQLIAFFEREGSAAP